ncbi:MAG TPA: DUF2937 family protein [Beijerinckiaceae bacterium]|nr:DUF2937 family protein [Beijerinckiaceae bacterium]
MIARLLTSAMVVVGGVSAVQLPEFAQQYRQRLGGATDELRAIVERFDADARSEGLSRAEALRKHTENAEELFRKRGAAMIDTIARQQRLERFRDDMAKLSGGNLTMALATRLDRETARSTFNDYEPAIPFTGEGGVLAILGGFVGWILARLLGWPKRAIARRLQARKETHYA